MMAVVFGMMVMTVLIVIISFTAIYTHESHIRDLRYANDEIVACIQKGHEPLECREMVYGRGN